MLICDTGIFDCYIIDPVVHHDDRGAFIKSFHKTRFEEFSLNAEFKEDFYSISKKNVIRGFHLAKPPSDHEKTVTCLSGEVLDVVLDLRESSPTFGRTQAFVLSSENRRTLYIGKGIGHAFMSNKDNTVLYYKVASEYQALDDIGVRWDSVNFTWPVKKPILSERDLNLPTFEQFKQNLRIR